MQLDSDGLRRALQEGFSVKDLLIECNRPSFVLNYDGTILNDDDIISEGMCLEKLTMSRRTDLCT